MLEQELWEKTASPDRNIRVMRSFEETRKSVIQLAKQFVLKRMQVHKPLLESLAPFLKPSSDHSTDVLRSCHQTIMPDFEFRDFVTAYRDFTNNAPYNGQDARALLLLSKSRPEWQVSSSGFARVIAATSHSCDVERLISSHNLLKTLDRSSLSSDTLNDYLHVNLNMPSLADFNVCRSAVPEGQNAARDSPATLENVTLV